jgi:pseudouridine synthase
VIRLQKYLAACGVASRRNAEKLIEAGRVRINDRIAALGEVVDPSVDRILCDGELVQEEVPVYLVLNKPSGIVTSAKDSHGRKTVLECLDGVKARVFPVGRLDMDVEGALILTNDGELAYRLSHPKYEIDKVYLTLVHGEPRPETVAQLEAGVPLEDGITAPAKVRVLNTRNGMALLRVVLHEGRKREVKRMCAAIGHPVRALRRIAIAGIHVKGLRPGEWRYLSPKEVESLHRQAGL